MTLLEIATAAGIAAVSATAGAVVTGISKRRTAALHALERERVEKLIARSPLAGQVKKLAEEVASLRAEFARCSDSQELQLDKIRRLLAGEK